MKANELMIGDWVGVGNRLVQITKLKKVSNEQQFFSVGYYHTEDKAEEGCFIDEIQPIPLTAEILEKNGFSRFSTSYLLEGEHFVLGNPSNPKQYMDNYWLRVCNRDIHIEYVHELQHALRLCGIDKEIVL